MTYRAEPLLLGACPERWVRLVELKHKLEELRERIDMDAELVFDGEDGPYNMPDDKEKYAALRAETMFKLHKKAKTNVDVESKKLKGISTMVNVAGTSRGEEEDKGGVSDFFGLKVLAYLSVNTLGDFMTDENQMEDVEKDGEEEAEEMKMGQGNKSPAEEDSEANGSSESMNTEKHENGFNCDLGNAWYRLK